MTEVGMQTARRLLSGARLPTLGLGVWQVPEGPDCERAVRWALECGYRLIDTAQAYSNEVSVGRAIRQSGIPREEIFLTTKFHPGRTDPMAEAVGSLRRLGTEYLDLYLVHWPRGGPTWAWRGMEATKAAGLATDIGVSNFSNFEIAKLIQMARVDPVVNQIQLSPFEYRRTLIGATEATGLVVQSYSPLGTGRHLTDPTVNRIATACGRSPAQILIRWGVQKNLSVITKSVHRDRIEENVQVFDFELNDQTMSELDALDETDASSLALSQDRRWW
jgi:diketogulonate reductase-like aldo/keto reductase